MPKLFKLGNHNLKGLVECNSQSPIDESLRKNEFQYCGDNPIDTCDDVGRKKQHGFAVECDPLISGKIYNDPVNPDPNFMFRYGRGIRGTDEAMLNMFKTIEVSDEDGKIFPIPVIWGTQEKAVSYILSNNVRKDNSLVVDRPTLPLMAINQTGIAPNKERYCYHGAINYFRDEYTNRPSFTMDGLKPKETIFGFSKGIPIDISYTLFAWTRYLEDMNQIVEQIIPKIMPMAYIKVKGIPWEIPVRLEGVGNNINVEPGDKNIRVVKYQFNMIVETYIPQPITVKKSVLKITTDLQNSVDKNKVTEIYNRIEVEPKEDKE